MDTFDLDEKILFTPKVLCMDYILIKFNHFLKNKLDDNNISNGEFIFLFNIFFHEPLSQRELADLLFVSEAYVTKMIKKLEQKNYVERKVDEKNKSIKNLYLTKTGKALTLNLLKITRQWESKLTLSLDENENEKLSYILYDLAYTTHKIEDGSYKQ